jgi:hypothetical protein
MIGGDNVTRNDLVISKLLGQNIEKYRSLLPHVSAAIQLSGEDKHTSKGDTIRYIYTDSKHKNPLCRVTSVENTNGSIDEVFSYDKEKYREMILDAADTVLGKQDLHPRYSGVYQKWSKGFWDFPITCYSDGGPFWPIQQCQVVVLVLMLTLRRFHYFFCC